MERERYITGPDCACPNTQLEFGFRKAAEIAVKRTPSQLLLTFSSKGVMGNIKATLNTLLGDKIVKSLEKNNKFIHSQLTLEIATDITIANMFDWAGPVLLIYPTQKMLDHIGDMTGVRAEIVVPWTEERVNNWKTAWSPKLLGNATDSVAVLLPTDVKLALESLTKCINFNNNLVTNDDRRDAIEHFRTMVKFCPSVNPVDVRAYLVGELNWPGGIASKAEELLANIQQDKRLQGGAGPNKGLYEYWKTKATE